jgi:hypothetical protein
VYSSLQLHYEIDTPQDDITPNESYFRYILKNIAPVIKNDNAYIPISGLFAFWRRSGYSYFEARKYFRDARAWTARNALRFTRDIQGLAAFWEDEA